LVAVLGPSASGKSDLAIDIARMFGAEILSADSLQVYRHLDIGTAKPTAELRYNYPHHLIDMVEPDEEFNAGLYRAAAAKVIDALHSSGKRMVVVGGTFLYVRVLLNGLVEGIQADIDIRDSLRRERASYGDGWMHTKLRLIDPHSAGKIHPNDYVRIERALEAYYLTGTTMAELRAQQSGEDTLYDCLTVCLSMDREDLWDRIEKRTDRMVERGLVDEVKGLGEMGYSSCLKPLQSIGYKEIIRHIKGEISLDEAVELIKRDTRRLVKRQMTWLRKEERLMWFHPGRDRDALMKTIEEFYLRGERR